MTTEQMNEVLADYIESDFVFQFHMDWNSLMLVIDKLRNNNNRSEDFKLILQMLGSISGTVLIRFVHEACYNAVNHINHEHKKNTRIEKAG